MACVSAKSCKFFRPLPQTWILSTFFSMTPMKHSIILSVFLKMLSFKGACVWDKMTLKRSAQTTPIASHIKLCQIKNLTFAQASFREQQFSTP
jgi:hypothetical protein